MRTRLCLWLHVFAATALLPLTAMAQSAQPLCLDGICIDAPITSLPKNIAWKPIRADERLSYINTKTPDETDRKYAKERLDRGIDAARIAYPGADSVYAQIADVLAGQERGRFDASLLPALEKLTVGCRPIRWIGSYVSAGGFETKVTLMLHPADERSAHRFRVQTIERSFPNIAAGPEFKTLLEKAQTLLGAPVNDDKRADGDNSPIASLSRSPAQNSATLTLADRPTGRFDTRKFGKEEACAKRISAQ